MARRGPVRAAPTAAAGRQPAPHPEQPAGRLALLPPDWLPLALIAGDALIVVASIAASYWYYVNLDPLRDLARTALPFGPYLPAMPVAAVFFAVSLAINGQYRSWRGRTLVDLLLGLYAGIVLATLLVLAAIAIGNAGVHYSRLTITYAVAMVTVLTTIERYGLRQYETRLRRQGIGTERVLMVGTGLGSEMLLRRMAMFPQYGYQVVGVLDDRLKEGASFAGAAVVGTVDELPERARELAVDQVFIALADRGRLPHLIKLCENEDLEFKVIPDLLDVMSTRAEVNSIDGLPLIGIRRSRLVGANAAAKRAIDVAASAFALLILAIPLGIVALAIRLSMPGGPVIFRQERIGRGGRPFTVLKFRTMIPDAEAKTGPVVAVPGDPRTTPFGRVMRKLSIDELPQFVNVLRGDMSLVGPRPQPTFFDNRYSEEVPRYLERQQVRPGLTGWAEVNDLRGAAPIEDRTIYDIYYIENWSLVLDLKILILTVMRLFFQTHAY